MPDCVTDTHALIWYLTNNHNLSKTAEEYFNRCEYDGGMVHIPSICLVEIIYLSEKGCIPTDIMNIFLKELNTGNTIFKVVNLNLSVVMNLNNVSRDSVPDMPDRIIATTALYLGFPLITRNMKIKASQVKTIW